MFNQRDIWSGRRDINPQPIADPRYRDDPRRQGQGGKSAGKFFDQFSNQFTGGGPGGRSTGGKGARGGQSAGGDPRRQGQGGKSTYKLDPRLYYFGGGGGDDDDPGGSDQTGWGEIDFQGDYGSRYFLYEQAVRKYLENGWGSLNISQQQRLRDMAEKYGLDINFGADYDDEGNPIDDDTTDDTTDDDTTYDFIDDEYQGDPGNVGPPSWMSGPGLPDPNRMRMFETGGEDTRGLPRGFGTDWFSDLTRHMRNTYTEEQWESGEAKKTIGRRLIMGQGRAMMNIMNRIANQGILGPEGRKFIQSGEKRESNLRRKELRKRLQRTLGRDLGGRAGGAATNMMFNQVDAPDFARREGKASELREFDMKSRMAGIEGNAQLMNMFNAWSLGEQTQSEGGPGALQTIGDVSKIAASIAAMFSDMRLKEDIEVAEPGLNEIAKLEPKTFTWKSTGEKDFGLIAQEVQEVIPDAVVVMPDGDNLGIRPMALISTLINSVKELKAELDELKAAQEV